MPLHVYKSRKRENTTTLPLRPSQGRPQQAKQQQQQQQKQQPQPQPPEQAASVAIAELQPSRVPMRSSKMSPSPEFRAQEETGKVRSRRRRLVAPPALLLWLASLSLLVLFANLSSSTHNQNHHRRHQHRRELENLLGNDIFGNPNSGGRSPEEQFAGPGQLELNAFVETRHVYKNNIPNSQEEEEEDEQDKGNVRPVVGEPADDDDDDGKLGPNSNPNTLNSDDHLDERTSEPEADSSNPHVPEQSPIVVSSSDNSYVSASPVAVEELTTSSQATTRQSHQHHSHSLHTSQVNLTLQKAFLSGRHKSQEALFREYTTGGQRESLENNLSKGEPNIHNHHNHRHSYQHRRQPEAEEQTSKTRQAGVNSRDHRQSIISDISTTATTTERSREPEIVHNTKGSSNRQPAALSPRNTHYEFHHSALRDSDTMEPNLVVADSSGSDKFNKLAEVMESNNLEVSQLNYDKFSFQSSTI